LSCEEYVYAVTSSTHISFRGSFYVLPYLRPVCSSWSIGQSKVFYRSHVLPFFHLISTRWTSSLAIKSGSSGAR